MLAWETGAEALTLCNVSSFFFFFCRATQGCQTSNGKPTENLYPHPCNEHLVRINHLKV